MQRYLAFTRRAAQKQRSGLLIMKRAVAKYKAQLRKLPDQAALNSLEPDADLTVDFTSSLIQIEIAAYVDGRTTSRRSPRRRANANTDFDIDKWLDGHVHFDWDLPAIETIQAFAVEAASYAQATMKTLLDTIKDDALAALNDGMSFLDWKDQMSLAGFESTNPYHLRTNFDTAANGSYHAGKWQEIQEYADMFPYLRYVTMQDNLVREEHAILDGTIAAVDDSFWSAYYPPNGYNCRCSVEQLMLSEAQADPNFGKEILSPQFDPRFMKNSGQTNTIFT